MATHSLRAIDHRYMIEIERLEEAVLILARAIESGRTEGITSEIQSMLGYIITSKE